MTTKTRIKKRSRRRSPRQRLLRALAVVALVVFAALAWLIWPFWQLSGQFGSTPMIQPSRLYGAPARFQVGDAGSPKTVAEGLEAAEYRALGEGQTLRSGTYRTIDRGVEVFRRRFVDAHGDEGGDRLRLRFSGGKISSIETLEGQPVNRVMKLEPPLIASFYGDDLKERRPMSLDELPEDLILAVLAAEDDGFLQHRGISIQGILRAAWVNFRAGEVEQGGSTLTQQLVKNLYLTHERRWERKLREVVLAVMLEMRYEKRDILQTYLNEIFWGRSGAVNVMGVGAAAWAWFGKHPTELTLGESALLAGMIQSPTNYSPRAHPETAKARRDVVLGRLAQLNWIDRARLHAAAQETIDARGRLVARRAPYFADWVEGRAARRFGITSLKDTGYSLFSTLSLTDQVVAEEAVDHTVKALEEGWEKDRGGNLEAALVSVDPSTGGILAWVGGRSYGRSQFDRVSQAKRQAGSIFKPIVYAAAFEAGVASPASVLSDKPFTHVEAGTRWSPQNSDGKYRGRVTARTALEKSLNVPTARLALDMGLHKVVDMAQRLGVESTLNPLPALSLGAMEVTPLEMATVYATLAASGERPLLHGLVAVYDRQGDRVPGPAPAPPRRVISDGLADLVNDVLRGVLDRGTAAKARRDGFKDPISGKTGTTNSRRDSWFAGYSPERATLVWVGYDDNRTTRLSGARAALPVFTRFAFKVRPVGGYAPPSAGEDVVEVLIDPSTGGLATTRCPAVVTERFLESHTPALCPEHSGVWARPLEQSPEVEIPEKENPFGRWLDRMRGRGSRSNSGGAP